MHTAVVELGALTDPVRPTPENDDGRFGERRELVFVFVRAVVVRRVRGEFSRARVDGLVGDVHVGGESRRAHVVGIRVPEVRELGIGESEPLGLPPVGARHRVETERCEALPFFHNEQDLVEEPWIDRGYFVDALERCEAAQCRFDVEETIGRRERRRPYQRVVVNIVELVFGGIAVEPEPARFQRANRLLQRLGKRPADCHHFTD